MIAARAALVAAVAVALPGMAGAAPANPGFEQHSNGRPAHWRAVGHPLLLTDRDDAAEGRAFVRVSAEHRYEQEIDVIGGLAHAVTVRARGQRGGELLETTEWIAVTAEWRAYTDSFTPATNVRRHTIRPATAHAREWVDVDAVSVLDELLDNGDFDGNAHWNGDVEAATAGFAALAGAQTLRQTVAVETGDKVYQLTGRAASDVVGDVSLSLTWLRHDGAIARADALTVSTATTWTPFALTVAPPDYSREDYTDSLSDDAVLCVLTLGAAVDGAPARWDALRLRWIAAVPRVLWLDGDTPRRATTVTWAAPDAGAWQARVEDAAGSVVVTATRNVAAPGVASLAWDGRDARGEPVAPGVYTIRVTTGDAPDAVELAATVETRRTPPRPPFARQEHWLPRGAWYTIPWDAPQDEATIRRDFAGIAAAGFNCVYVLHAPPVPYAWVFDAARAHGLKLFLAADFFFYNAYSKHAHGEITLDRVERQLARLQREAGAGWDHLVGHVIWDEPTREHLPRLEEYARLLAARDPTRPAFFVLNPDGDYGDALARTATPALLTDLYPFGVMDPVGGYRDLHRRLRVHAALAGDHDLPWWIMYAAFRDAYRFRMGTPAEQRRIVYEALALGARGVFYFFANPLQWGAETAAGLLDAQGRPSMPELAALNDELHRLEPIILACRPVADGVHAPEQTAAGLLRSATGQDYLVAVHLDCVRSRAATFALPGATAGRALDVLSGRSWAVAQGEVTVPLGPGEGLVLRLDDGPVAPVAPPPPRPDPRAGLVVISPAAALLTGEWGLDQLATNGRVLAAGRFRRYVSTRPVFLFDISDPLAPRLGRELATYRADRFRFAGSTLWIGSAGLGVIGYEVASADNAPLRARLTGLYGNAVGVVPWGERLLAAAREGGVRVLRPAGETLEVAAASAIGAAGDAGLALPLGERLLALALQGPSAWLDAATLRRTAWLPAVTHARDAVVYRGRVYIAALNSGLMVLDPALPPGEEVVYQERTLEAMAVAVYRKYLLLADGPGALRVYSLDDPARPRFVRTVAHAADGTVDSVAVCCETVYTCSRAGGVFATPAADIIRAASTMRVY